MLRRQFLAVTAALSLPMIARPVIARAEAQSVLRFVPAADLASFDPVWTTASQTRDHAMMVYDTLYGLDDSLTPQPQMVQGHVVEEDGKRWTLTLRPNLAFHDGTKVLARDCVASIRRWAQRDSFGQLLIAATDELSAPDDTHIVFRLKSPFPQLPYALGKLSSICVIMPERLAKTDAYTQVTDPTGSGPFRVKLDERVPGSRTVYERFAGYVPRPDGTPSSAAGPKIVHFDRVESLILPDGATASAALRRGEVDWLRWPLVDLLPQLRADKDVVVRVIEPQGLIGIFRFNHLHPPFDNAAVRRAVLPAFSQADYMTAAQGDDRSLWKTGVGFFCPGTPMASDVGMEALTAPRNLDAAKKALAASGYAGQRTVVMKPTDFPIYDAMADVTGQLLKDIGFNVDVQAMDWATAMQRRAKLDPVEKGGWSVFHTGWGGVEQSNPVTDIWLRGNGSDAAPGWPTSPELERLRDAWLAAPDLPKQQAVAAEMQRQAFTDLPYIPTGQLFTPVAYRANLTGMLQGLPVFWNVQRS
jgi:peptide/nickel transport system substrate-binding protein